MSASVRLAVFIAASLMLLMVTVVLVPYRIDECYINRKTGEISTITSICLISRTETSSFSYVDLATFGKLSAPNERLLMTKSVYPFPWSHASMPSHWRSEHLDNHFQLKMFLIRAFYEPADFQRAKAILTKEQLSARMAKRLMLWNSHTVDGRLEAVVGALDAENDRLFPGAHLIVEDKFVVPSKP